MDIKASDVKKLREETNAGMMDCKKALVESEGDFEMAKLLLREKGQSKADKKSGRITAEGLVKVETSENHIAILEINCETDFAAKDALFNDFVNQVSALILSKEIDTLDELNKHSITEFESVEDFRKFVISKIGENITVRRFNRILNNGTSGSYIHGNKIASVVIIKDGDEALAKDLAMHVAAVGKMVYLTEKCAQHVPIFQ